MANPSFRKVVVDLPQRGYDIVIGPGALATCHEFITQRSTAEHYVVVTDSNVDELYADRLADFLSAQGLEIHVLVVDPGEESKSPDVVAEIWETMLSEGSDRTTAILAVGGGVVGDLAGFIAATFARGIPYFQIPTTLLAQVDSSVGGKVGINLPEAKNMVGAFWQPAGVLVDVDVLASLPDRELAAGLAEVVKYGVILDAEFFAWLEEHAEAIWARDTDLLTQVVERCCRLKADVVIADEQERKGTRIKLNYGHTFGHALEAVTGYGQILHGEGVAIGMICASRLAERMGRIGADVTERQVRLLSQFRLPTELPAVDVDEMLRLMWHDKKVEHGEIRFVLPSALGRVEAIGNISSGLVKEILTTPDA